MNMFLMIALVSCLFVVVFRYRYSFFTSTKCPGFSFTLFINNKCYKTGFIAVLLITPLGSPFC